MKFKITQRAEKRSYQRRCIGNKQMKNSQYDLLVRKQDSCIT